MVVKLNAHKWGQGIDFRCLAVTCRLIARKLASQACWICCVERISGYHDLTFSKGRQIDEI